MLGIVNDHATGRVSGNERAGLATHRREKTNTVWQWVVSRVSRSSFKMRDVGHQVTIIPAAVSILPPVKKWTLTEIDLTPVFPLSAYATCPKVNERIFISVWALVAAFLFAAGASSGLRRFAFCGLPLVLVLRLRLATCKVTAPYQSCEVQKPARAKKSETKRTVH